MSTRLLILLASLLSACEVRASPPRVIHQSRSPYNEIIVTESRAGVRSLRFQRDGAIQSLVDPRKPLDLLLPYTQAAMLSLALVPEPQRVLVIGLGGGAMPRFLHRLFPKALVEVVELDPEVVRVAREYFAVKEGPRFKVHVGDGRAFLERSTTQWDLLFLDAYGDEDIPRALATVEFLQTVRERLAPGGLVVGNVWSDDINPLHARMRATYEKVFPRLCILEARDSRNQIFLAPAGREPVDAAELKRRAANLESARRLPFDLDAHAADGCLPPPPAPAALLQDGQP